MEGHRPVRLNRLTAPLGTHNALLSARARAHFVRDFPGPLSIKSVTEGTVAWKTGGRELVVDRDSFLILNHREPYSMEIESRKPVSTLCVFFQDGFVESLQASLTQAGIEPAFAAAAFPGRLHARDTRILPRLQEIAGSTGADGLWLDEQYLELARDLLLLHDDLGRRIRLMPARRASTRDELFRRVRRGQEAMHADPTIDWSLAELARESCLSLYHFHRAFTSAFGKTPHHYRNELRLARARRLLETTEMTVTEICGAVGFESAPSFTTLYRRSFGIPPTQSRKLSNSR
jgi:AraC-like DNA-binding protein